MSLIRPRQRAITAVSPHNANSKYLIPKRTGGYRPLAWSTIPGQQFYTGIPAQVDFRQWLSGTNRQSATITAGDVYPAGFTFNNGVLSWDGTGNPSPGFEQSCIASDGEGPDTESGLFTVSVVSYTALAWSGPLAWSPSVGGGVQTFDVRAELSGTSAATANIGVGQLPAGYTFDGSILSYDGASLEQLFNDATAVDGIGPAAVTDFDVIPVESIDLVSQAFSINEKNGSLDSRDPGYAYISLSWLEPVGPLQAIEGTPISYNSRNRLQGTNRLTATISLLDSLPTGWDFVGGETVQYDGVSGPASGSVRAFADDGTSSAESSPAVVETVSSSGDFTPQPGYGLTFTDSEAALCTLTRPAGGLGSTGPVLEVYEDWTNYNVGQAHGTAPLAGRGNWSNLLPHSIVGDASLPYGKALNSNGSVKKIEWCNAAQSGPDLFLFLVVKLGTHARNYKYFWPGRNLNPNFYFPSCPNSGTSGMSFLQANGGYVRTDGAQVDDAMIFNQPAVISLWCNQTGGPKGFQTYCQPGRGQTASRDYNNWDWGPGNYAGLNIPGYISGHSTSDIFRVSQMAYATGPGACARVEITDAAVYDQSGRKSYCTIESWSDTAVQFRLRKGFFHQTPLVGSGLHLHLFDSNNNHQYVGVW